MMLELVLVIAGVSDRAQQCGKTIKNSYICVGICMCRFLLGGGSELKDGLGVYWILPLIEAAFYLIFKVWRN